MNFSTIYSIDINKINSSDITGYVKLAPNTPDLYDSLGHLKWQENGVIFNNPMAYLLQKYTATTNQLLNNLVISYQLTRNLVLKSNTGFSTFKINEVNTNPIESQNPAYSPLGYSQFGNNNYQSWIIEPQMEYNTVFKDFKLFQLSLEVLLAKQNKNSYTSFFVYGYLQMISFWNQFLQASSLSVIGNNSFEYRYEALFGHASLNWRDKINAQYFRKARWIQQVWSW